MKIYDISQEVFSCAVYPGDPKPEKQTVYSTGAGDLYNLSFFAMCAALDDVELGIGIGTLCLPGIFQIYDIILGAMDDQHRAPIGLDFLIGIHADHISHIAPAQLHGTAVQAFGDILRVKFGKHHLTRPGIVGDTQCRIEQHQLVN